MNRRAVMTGIIIVIVFQVAVLASTYLGAVYPLWTGREIKLKTVPVDPRSMFRGNYARLRYDIANIDMSAFGPEGLRSGEVVYVMLKPVAAGLYESSGASLEKPKDGVFIRGRFRNYRVFYGIEAFFAPKEKALALERKLRDGGVAIVMVSDSGKATLKDVIPE